MIPHALKIEDVLKELETNPSGLQHETVKAREMQYGPNKLPEKKKRSPILRFLAQFHSALVYILLAAALISFFFERSVDAYVILAVVILNACIGFIQEARAEHAMEALEKLVVVTSSVLRGGELLKLPAEQLVPGDIILLEEGNKVPADARILEEEELRALEASLTGESVSVDKDAGPVAEDTPLADRANMVWMSTLVVAGKAKAIVTATGVRTAIGQVARDVAAIKPPATHFQKRTRELAWTMALIALAGAALTLGVGWFWLHLPFIEVLLFSIAALVSSMPEGLPAVLTIVLAIGAFRMARVHAIVRHLPATETLSITTVIATDKTGTLTQNSMTVRELVLGSDEHFSVTGTGWNPTGEFLKDGAAVTPLDHPELSAMLHAALFGADAKLLRTKDDFDIAGDPTEAALVVMAEKAGLLESRFGNRMRVIHELPFQRKTKYRARLVERDGSREIIVIGAFENILERSVSVRAHDHRTELRLDDEKRETFLAQGIDMGDRALRVLGIASRSIPAKTDTITHEDIKNLAFLGLVGMIDPPRPEALSAIRAAQGAGIRVIMKTGDHKATAVAIAKEVGILAPQEKTEALTDAELIHLSDDALDAAVRAHSVFARVTPKTKLRITKSLQRQGEVVAVTGDGVNDAPALRQADIGIAMGKRGTDVAREASDLVLEDDNFATIVNAIEEGRTVFRNTQQTSFYLVTTNMAEYAVILGSLALGLPLPLLPIHLLWMNLVTDGVTDIALAAEPKHAGILREPPKKQRERILNKEVLPFLALMVIIMLAGTISFFVAALPQGVPKARTFAFVFMAWAQLWNVWNMRAIDRSLFRIGVFKNNIVTVAFLAGALIQFIIIGIPPFQTIFQFIPLTIGEWAAVIVSSSLVLWFGEIYKFIRYKKIPILTLDIQRRHPTSTSNVARSRGEAPPNVGCGEVD